MSTICLARASTLREAAAVGAYLHSGRMSRGDKKISADPLFTRLRERKGGAAAFARALNVSDQVLSNWKRRGIPAGELYRVAHALGITAEEYLAEAGKPVAAREVAAQYTIGRTTLLQDFDRLPPWLQEYIVRKTGELRRYVEALPAFVRDGMKGPPSDAEGYRSWERDIMADMEARLRGIRAQKFFEPPGDEPKTPRLNTNSQRRARR